MRAYWTLWACLVTVQSAMLLLIWLLLIDSIHVQYWPAVIWGFVVFNCAACLIASAVRAFNRVIDELN